MKKQLIEQSQDAARSEIRAQSFSDREEIGGRRNDWRNSDWLSDWLKLARERNTRN